MLALTLTAPWGTAIMQWSKYIENRDWVPPDWLVGQRLAIHQGKQLDKGALLDLQTMCTGFPLADELPHGCLLGSVLLHGYVSLIGGTTRWHGPRLQRGALERILRSGWRSADASVLWCVKDPRSLRSPVPCRGLQKLWTVPTEHEVALRALEGAHV